MLNSVHIHGRLTADPELRSTPGGTKVCNFNIATNEKYTDGNGKEQENVAYIGITVWGDLADVVARHKKKGHPVIVSGKITMEQWKDKETGKNREKLVVTAFGVEFLPYGDGKKDDDRQDDRKSGRR